MRPSFIFAVALVSHLFNGVFSLDEDMGMTLEGGNGNTTENEIVTNSPSGASTVWADYTSIPSFSPTTITNSEHPTASPTQECHDLESYRSPINKLRCKDHRNTNCLKWKCLGLTDADVVELLRSCPLSCDVDCGYSMNPSSSPTVHASASPSESKRTVTAEVVFYLYNLNTTLLGNETIEVFELFTYAYLKQQEKTFSKTTELISFKIKSQSEVTYGRRLRGLSGDTSGGNVIKIVATVTALTAFQKPVSSPALLNFTTQAIDHHEYDEALNQNEHFYDVATSLQLNSPVKRPEPEIEPEKTPKVPGVEVDNHSDIQNSGDNEPSNKKRSKSMTVAIISSVIASAFVVLGGFLLRKQMSPLMDRIKGRAILMSPSNDSSSSYSCEISANDGTGEMISRSHLSRCLTMHPSDDSPIDLDFKDNGHLNNVPQIEEQNKDASDRSPMGVKKTLFTSSPISPQMSHIPPMIVIDNIDEEINSPHEGDGTDYYKMSHEKNEEEDSQTGLFVTRIEATSDLVAALSANRPPNPKQAYNLLNPLKCDDKSEMSAEASAYTIVSSRLSLGDAASSMSTPCTSKNMIGDGTNINPSLTKNNVFTFGSESELEPKDDFSVLFEKKMKEGDKYNQKLNLRGLFKRRKSPTFGKEDSPSAASHYESDAGSSEGSDVLRERDRLDESNLIPPQEDSDSDISSNHDEDVSLDSSLKYTSEEKVADFTNERDTPDKIAIQRHARNISSASSTFFHKRNMSEFSFSTGHLYSFQAPTSGKLGIIIQSKGSSAPTVFQVKDYSPLLGQVKPGDKIVGVDGIDTSQMNTNEITDLLAKRRSNSNGKNRKIKITIMSKYRKEGIQPDSLISEQIDMIETSPGDERDDFEVPQTVESDEKDYSDGDHSCHLLGAVDSEDYDEEPNFGVYAERDQFL